MRTYYNIPTPHDRYVQRREVTKKKGNRQCYRCRSEDHLINYRTAPKTPRRAPLLPPSSAVSPGPPVRPASTVFPQPLVRLASSVLPGPRPLVWPALLVLPSSPLLLPPPKEEKEQQQHSGDRVAQFQEVVEVATVPSNFQVWTQ